MKKSTFTAVILIISVILAFSSCSAGLIAHKSENTGTDMDRNNFPGGNNPQYTEEAEITSERYHEIEESPAILTAEETTATLSLKVDTAAYSNIARIINNGQRPPADAVRTEEMINYFSYEGELENAGGPFYMRTEIGASPFGGQKHMAFIRVKTPDIDKSDMPYNNLTFLIDTSGSMDSYDKLPLLKSAFRLLVETLDENDRVSIVTYAGSSTVALDSVSGGDKGRIIDAIDTLSASGSTAGANGIETAYELASKNFKSKGNNRIILASDGDFNVGISDTKKLERFISEKRDSGIYLSILGFGTGNLRDDIMETLSKSGNGNYSYIDSLQTARKVLVKEMGANLITVADDVKAQVVFNSETVKSYRLIGYENRMLQNEEFNDDKKDAGEIGAGSDVVIMFELELHGNAANGGSELFSVNIRYKDPGQSESKLIGKSISGQQITKDTSSDYNFACSVAVFGHLLRNSKSTGSATISTAVSLAQNNLGTDKDGYRKEYLELLKKYSRM